MVGVELEFVGYELEQALLDLVDVFAGGEAGAVGDAENMRVHGDGRLAESGVEYDIGGLAPHARQGFEGLARLRYFATVSRNEQAAGFDDVPGLGLVQAYGADVGDELVQAQLVNGLRCARYRIELARGKVDALVGGLRRQDHRDQQFKRCGVFELGARRRISGAQAAENGVAFLRVHACAPGNGGAIGWKALPDGRFGAMAVFPIRGFMAFSRPGGLARVPAPPGLQRVSDRPCHCFAPRSFA